MAIRRFDSHPGVGEEEMKLFPRGDDLFIQAKFSRRKGNLELFLAELRSTLALWMRHHPLIESATTSLEETSSEPSIPLTVKQGNAHVRFPKSLAEEKQLMALAVQGPGAVYRWIYGEESLMAKAMNGTTWDQFGVQDVNEGCQRILRSIFDHQTDLKVVRPKPRRHPL